MAGKRGPFMLILVLPLLAACGDSGSGPEDQEQSVVLHVIGTVSSQPTGQPIEGATVELGLGGHVSLPVVRVTALTDEQGTYELTDLLNYQGSCPLLWVRASATGHVPPQNQQQMSVSCSAETQVVGLALEPVP